MGPYKLHDVSDVYVSKPKPQEGDGEDDDREKEAGALGMHISKASLRGKGVLQSPELRLLDKRGFYISKIIWTATDDALSDLHEFEAQFADPDEGRDFNYLPRGFYKRLEEGGFVKTRTGYSKDQEQGLGRMIEAAARNALETIAGDQNDKN